MKIDKCKIEGLGHQNRQSFSDSKTWWLAHIHHLIGDSIVYKGLFIFYRIRGFQAKKRLLRGAMRKNYFAV